MAEVSAGDLLLKRRRLGLRQNEAAKLLGINPSTLVDLEKEKIRVEPDQRSEFNARYDQYTGDRKGEAKAA